jgi:hypothetical protein
MKTKKTDILIREFCNKHNYLYYKVYKSTEYFIHGKFHVDNMMVIDEKIIGDISLLEKHTKSLLNINKNNILYKDLLNFINDKKLLFSLNNLEETV